MKQESEENIIKEGRVTKRVVKLNNKKGQVSLSPLRRKRHGSK